MSEEKTLFRRVYEAMMEGRTRQANRHIVQYLKTHPLRDVRQD